MALHQDIEDMALLLHRPPLIVTFAIDDEKYLVEVPLIVRPGMPAPELVGILLAELHAPLPDGFVGHDDPTGAQ